MKSLQVLAAVVCVTASISCSTIEPDTTSSAKVTPGVPGGEYTETAVINATVTAINPAKREVTFVTPDKKAFSTTAGEEVKNFGNIQIGDQLRITLTETIEVRMAKPGENPEDLYDYTTEVASSGQKPGLEMEDVAQISATVSAIDPKRRKATLTFPDGKSKKFDVRSDIDLSQRKVGEKVVIRTTEHYAIKIEKP